MISSRCGRNKEQVEVVILRGERKERRGISSVVCCVTSIDAHKSNQEFAALQTNDLNTQYRTGDEYRQWLKPFRARLTM